MFSKFSISVQSEGNGTKLRVVNIVSRFIILWSEHFVTNHPPQLLYLKVTSMLEHYHIHPKYNGDSVQEV
jgi:hypothetical protein